MPKKSRVGVIIKSFASAYPICVQQPSLELPSSHLAWGSQQAAEILGIEGAARVKISDTKSPQLCS